MTRRVRTVSTSEDVHAAFNDGILTLQLPKKDAAKQIEDQKHQIKIA